MIDQKTQEMFNFLQSKGGNTEKNLPNIPMMADGKTPDIEKIKEILEKFKPVTSQDYLKDPENIPLDKEGGVIIIPDPGFVFKTKDNRGGKIFINITHHPLIDKPEEKEIVDAENQMGIRIPMSMGDVREDFDKNRKPCKVIDVIVHPDICNELQTDKTKAMLQFFRELLTSYILQKHKIQVSPKNFRIPKMRYKGGVVEHQRVRGKKKPKIDIMNSTKFEKESQNNPEFNENLKKNISEETGIRKPKWELKLIPSEYTKEDDDYELVEFDGFNFNNEEASGFLITVELPLMTTGKYFNLQVSDRTLHLKCGRFYKLDLSIPVLFLKDKVNAFFDVDKRILKIRGYFEKSESEGSEDEGDVEVEVENIISKNTKKIEEKGIKIESDLLTNIV